MSNTNNKHEKFIRLAEKRVTRALESIRIIGNLANKSNYSYKGEDIKQILSALKSELDNLKTKFSSNSSSEKYQFRFKT